MFDNDNVWDLNKMQEEQYLVKLTNIPKLQYEWVFVSNKQDLAELITLIPKQTYSITNVTSLYNASTYQEFKKDIINKNKPEDLNFGGLN